MKLLAVKELPEVRCGSFVKRRSLLTPHHPTASGAFQPIRGVATSASTLHDQPSTFQVTSPFPFPYTVMKARSAKGLRKEWGRNASINI